MSQHPYPIMSRPIVFASDQDIAITANGVTETISGVVPAGTYYGWNGTETAALGDSLLWEFLSNLASGSGGHSEISSVTFTNTHSWANGYPQARIQFTKGGDNPADEIDWSSNGDLAAALGFENVPLAIDGNTAVDVTGDWALGYLFVGACRGRVNGIIKPDPHFHADMSQPEHNRQDSNFFVVNHGETQLLTVEYDLVDDANISSDLRREVAEWAAKAGVETDDPNNILEVFLRGCANGETIRLYDRDSNYKKAIPAKWPMKLSDHAIYQSDGKFSVSIPFWEQG